MQVKSYSVSLMIQQCIFNQEYFPKINRSTSIIMELEKISNWIKLNKLTLNGEKKLNT